MFSFYDYDYLDRWFIDFNQSISMYDVGRFFLSHKMIVRRMKNKRRGK